MFPKLQSFQCGPSWSDNLDLSDTLRVLELTCGPDGSMSDFMCHCTRFDWWQRPFRSSKNPGLRQLKTMKVEVAGDHKHVASPHGHMQTFVRHVLGAIDMHEKDSGLDTLKIVGMKHSSPLFGHPGSPPSIHVDDEILIDILNHPRLTSVQDLTLGNSDITNDITNLISTNLTRLKSLSLRNNSDLTPVALNPLLQLSKLEEVTIRGCRQIDLRDLVHYGNLFNIRRAILTIISGSNITFAVAQPC